MTAILPSAGLIAAAINRKRGGGKKKHAMKERARARWRPSPFFRADGEDPPGISIARSPALPYPGDTRSQVPGRLRHWRGRAAAAGCTGRGVAQARLGTGEHRPVRTRALGDEELGESEYRGRSSRLVPDPVAPTMRPSGPSSEQNRSAVCAGSRHHRPDRDRQPDDLERQVVLVRFRNKERKVGRSFRQKRSHLPWRDHQHSAEASTTHMPLAERVPEGGPRRRWRRSPGRRCGAAGRPLSNIDLQPRAAARLRHSPRSVPALSDGNIAGQRSRSVDSSSRLHSPAPVGDEALDHCPHCEA